MSEALRLFEADPEGFTALVTAMAPYAGTIQPRITALRHGYCEVRFAKRREVENHLGTVHAIAICNAAELAAGALIEASIPAGHRWIPEGMTTRYLGKARSDLRVVADGAGLDLSRPGVVEVPVRALDSDGREVFSARIRMNLRAPAAAPPPGAVS